MSAILKDVGTAGEIFDILREEFAAMLWGSVREGGSKRVTATAPPPSTHSEQDLGGEFWPEGPRVPPARANHGI